MEDLSRQIGKPQNRLLAAFTPAAFNEIRHSLEYVPLPRGETLIRPHLPIEYVYFPERGMVSLVQPLLDGEMIEVGVVGQEGFVGVPILLGATRWPVEAMVQMPGAALRLPASILSEIAKRRADVQNSLLRYSQSLLIQISQSAACNARHHLQQRLARWLLMAHDRADGADLPLSHEFLSMMLGTRRAGVSVALSKFKAAGLVRNGHGRITITDRSGLEEAACECYRVVTAEISRLLK